MAINFPDSPSVGDEFTGGGFTWTWSGSSWEKLTTASGVDKRGYFVPNGLALITDNFTAGFFIFKLRSNETGTFTGSTIQLYDSSDVEIATLLGIAGTGGTSSLITASYLSSVDVAKIKVSGAVDYDAYLEIERYDTASVIAATRITASTTYSLSSAATVYVFGGGGGGGEKQFPPAGNGNASSFDVTTANGGSKGGNLDSAGPGGNGGSGGGGAGNSASTYGIGGQNGGDGGNGNYDPDASLGGTGSGVSLPIALPASVSNTAINRAGNFYCGGNGGSSHTNVNGFSADANTAGGGGGGSFAGSGGASGGGGSGYFASASYSPGSYSVVIGAGGTAGGSAGTGGSGVVWVVA